MPDALDTGPAYPDYSDDTHTLRALRTQLDANATALSTFPTDADMAALLACCLGRGWAIYKRPWGHRVTICVLTGEGEPDERERELSDRITTQAARLEDYLPTWPLMLIASGVREYQSV